MQQLIRDISASMSRKKNHPSLTFNIMRYFKYKTILLALFFNIKKVIENVVLVARTKD